MMNLRALMLMTICCWTSTNGLPKIDNISEDNLVTYHYRYSVDELQRRGPLMDRWEQRLGEYVKGAYSVMQPDGRIRTVNYEVDGNKGYHAIIRMNQPGPELLSIQQLSESNDIFPEAVLPTTNREFRLPPTDSKTEKLINYHANTPYHNAFSTSKVDHKPAANTQFTDRVLPTATHKPLPLSPSNYNVPQTTNLIYFRTPAATIFQKTEPGVKQQRDVSQQYLEPRVTVQQYTEPRVTVQQGVPQQYAESGITEVFLQTPRRRRNSKLVKRFKSFAEAFS